MACPGDTASLTMRDSINETFTADLHYNAELTSLEDIENEIEERETPSNYYNEEELKLIWDTLKQMYKKEDEHYIIMYLMYSLGFSFRKVATVIGRGPSFVFLYAKQAIEGVQKRLGVEIKAEPDDEEPTTTELPGSEGF